jgi:beta-N-acetylhexosaminidase
VRGTEGAGVSSTLKHFPGHGDTVTDSHTGVPWIFHTREQWEQIDAPPFRAGIAAGADMVMTAHVVMPELQSDCDVATQEGCDPATLDREILTGLLREELGYGGVVVTDALNMAGVREKYGDARIPVLALKAGVDMPMMIDTPTDTVSLDVAYDAVRSGELSVSRIDESVRRVLELKVERGLVDDPFVNASKAAGTLGTAEHLAVAGRVGDNSVTLLNAEPAAHLAETLRRREVPTELYETGTAPDAATIANAVSRAQANDLVVVTTSNASGSQSQRNLVNALLATGKPVVLVATRNPYDIAALIDAPTYVASYSWTKPSMQALARVLLGEVNPSGKLPVRIPKASDPAATLYPFGFGIGY